MQSIEVLKSLFNLITNSTLVVDFIEKLKIVNSFFSLFGGSFLQSMKIAHAYKTKQN